MFLIIICSTIVILLYLMLMDYNEKIKNGKNIGCGWKVTPYLKLKISSVENRADLERLRLIELIKNTLEFEKNIEILETTSDSLLVKIENDFRFLEVFTESDFEKVNKKEFRYKLGRGTECSVYNLIKKTINTHVWYYDEENLGNYGHRIYLSFRSGMIILDISKSDGIIFARDKNEEYVKK